MAFEEAIDWSVLQCKRCRLKANANVRHHIKPTELIKAKYGSAQSAHLLGDDVTCAQVRRNNRINATCVLPFATNSSAHHAAAEIFVSSKCSTRTQ